jgi:Winged helix-turn helix
VDAGAVSTVIGWLFHVRYTPCGTSYLLHWIEFAPQVPAHRAAQRDEPAIAAWQDVTWVKVRGWRRRPKRTSASRTRPGSPGGRRRPAPGPPRPYPGGPGIRERLSERVSAAGLVISAMTSPTLADSR